MAIQLLVLMEIQYIIILILLKTLQKVNKLSFLLTKYVILLSIILIEEKIKTKKFGIMQLILSLMLF